MVEIEQDTICTPVTVQEHEFHEGSSVKKINGKYFYLFADTHRHGDPDRPDGRPSCLGYAVSDHPMHGFVYGGVIIDNFGCDPAVWNNHGSMECFNGQWYVFYHRSTHGTEFSRHVCAERIRFLADGSIPQVSMTSSGIASAIAATELIPASLACELCGRVRIAGSPASSYDLVLTEIAHGDSATYRYLDFAGENTCSICMQADANCRVELYIDGSYHADFKHPASENMTQIEVAIPPIFGKHTLTLKLYGRFTSATVETITFSKK